MNVHGGDDTLPAPAFHPDSDALRLWVRMPHG